MELSEQLQMWFEAGANATGVAHIPIADIAEVQRELAQLEKEKRALERFDGNDPIPILRLCAKTLENSDKWSKEIRLARANWLRRFATHLKK